MANPDQIVIRLDGNEDVITYTEWREFVESRRGKWQGVASREGARALREYVDGIGEDDASAGGDEDVEALKDEIERLTRENERLTQENERLHAMLDGGATPRDTPDMAGHQTKNDPSELTKFSDGSAAASAAEAAGTDETVVWSWEDYDPDAHDITVPEAAITRLPDEYDTVDDPTEFDGEQVPAINPEHVHDVPGKDAEAKAALAAGVVRYGGDIVDEGGIIARTKEVTGNSTTGYVRNAIVFDERDAGPETPVVAWLAGRHPNDSAKWVTSVDAFVEILDSRAADAASERERFLQGHIGVAFGAPQYLNESKWGSRPYVGEKYCERWMVAENELRRELDHPLAYDVIRGALQEMVGTDDIDGRLAEVPLTEFDDEEILPEWPDTAEEIVRWWDEEKRDADNEFADGDVERIAAALRDYVPEERQPWTPDDDGGDEEVAEEVESEMDQLEAAE